MTTVDALSDLSTLTFIPKASLDKLMNQIPYIICQSLLESKLNNDNHVIANLGFGQLELVYTDDELLYKFIPNKKTETMFINTLISGESPLETKIEDGVRHRIMNVYKELL